MSWGETIFLKNKIINHIEGQKVFVASDTIIKDGRYITPKLNGTMNAVLTIYNSFSGTISGTCRIYVENEMIKEQNFTFLDQVGTHKVNIPFNVQAGQTYRIEYSGSSQLVLQNVGIGAQITDYNYFE